MVPEISVLNFCIFVLKDDVIQLKAKEQRSEQEGYNSLPSKHINLSIDERKHISDGWKLLWETISEPLLVRVPASKQILAQPNIFSVAIADFAFRFSLIQIQSLASVGA